MTASHGRGLIRNAKSQALPQNLFFKNRILKEFAGTLKFESMHLKDAHSKKDRVSNKEKLPASRL